MTAQRKSSTANSEDSTLSRLGKDVLASCREALEAAGDLSPAQLDRLLGLATGSTKPKPTDLQAILEEEGELR